MAAFKYYMHDDYQADERIDWISEQTGIDMGDLDAASEKMGRPFYEIQLDCDYDPESGRVSITGVAGVPLTRPVSC